MHDPYADHYYSGCTGIKRLFRLEDCGSFTVDVKNSTVDNPWILLIKSQLTCVVPALSQQTLPYLSWIWTKNRWTIFCSPTSVPIINIYHGGLVWLMVEITKFSHLVKPKSYWKKSKKWYFVHARKVAPIPGIFSSKHQGSTKQLCLKTALQ